MRRKKRGFVDTRKWYRYQFFGNATVTVPKDKVVVNATIANISFSGLGLYSSAPIGLYSSAPIGLYSSAPIGRGKGVKIKISFIDRAGKVREDITAGKIDWQKKFRNTYLIGIIFDEELTIVN